MVQHYNAVVGSEGGRTLILCGLLEAFGSGTRDRVLPVSGTCCLRAAEVWTEVAVDRKCTGRAGLPAADADCCLGLLNVGILRQLRLSAVLLMIEDDWRGCPLETVRAGTHSLK